MFLCRVLFVASSVVAAAVIRCVISDCEVLVQEPWPMPHLLVPIGSDVEINCTAAVGTADSPFWSIDLAADLSNIQLQFATAKRQLNARGVYELPPIETPLTLRLLINDTAINNQTQINCYRGAQFTTTVLRVFEYYDFEDFYYANLYVLPGRSNSTVVKRFGYWCHLTWDLSGGDAPQNFLLTISYGSSTDIMSLNESTYHFTAPEGAPPCEVYNFSITATYVGATYTGAGCSLPSPVLSTMLPSLPSIDRLESSFNYVLSKKSGGLSLQVSFEPASYCENYPVTNYTLIISSFNDELLVSMLGIHADNLTFDTGNLSENAEYSFRILVSNTVGIVSTNNTHFYTTDVQQVVAILSNGMNASTLQCVFITGSDATGCMVVLTGEYSQKVQYNLSRNSTMSEVLNVTLKRPPSCYTEVEAFDIESDGSVGTLPVSGQLEGRLETPCAPVEVIPESSNLAPWIITTVVVAAMVTLLCGPIIAVIIVAYKSRRVRKNICQGTNSNGSSQADDHYEQIPMNNGPNEINCTDIIKTAPNEVYGVSTDGIETTSNVVYGVSTDGIETTPNEVLQDNF